MQFLLQRQREHWNAASVVVLDDVKANDFATPFEIAGDDGIYVSRIRSDNSKKNALNLWVVSDNLTKGAALNAVQIAEKLIKDFI
jgi:aspartate-semialdehyde dehydrogenase